MPPFWERSGAYYGLGSIFLPVLPQVLDVSRGIHGFEVDIRWIDFGALRAAGYLAVCFDKDNTLTLPYKDTIHSPLQEALEDCKKSFAKIVVMSNSAGTPDDTESMQAKGLEASLDLPVLRHRWKKPLCGQDLVKYLGVDPVQIVIIGDRLTTDIFLANDLGMLSIHTKPLDVRDDNRNARRFRDVENWILDRLYYAYSRPDLQERFIKPTLK